MTHWQANALVSCRSTDAWLVMNLPKPLKVATQRAIADNCMHLLKNQN